MGAYASNEEPAGHDHGPDGRADLPDQARESVETCLNKFFHMLDRLVTVLRVYPRHHPVIDGVTERAMRRLDLVHEGARSVSVELTPSEVLSEWGNAVFSREESETGRFIWYNAHSDGLRFLTFLPGLDAGELKELMGVVAAADASEISSDDDTVTLLWQKQLSTISYRSVDTFVDSETVEELNQHTSKELVDMLVDAAIEPEGEAGREIERMFEHVGIECLDWFTAQRVGHSFQAKPIEASEEDLAFALSVSDKLIDSLYAEWHSGSVLEFRFIEALLSVMRTSPASVAADHARSVIERMTLEMIDNEMHQAAVRVLELLASRIEMFAHAEHNPLEEVFARASSPERVDPLLWQLQKDDDAELVRSLLVLLDTDVVQHRLLMLLSSDDTELARIDRLVELLVALTDQTNAEVLEDHKLTKTTSFAARIFEHVAPEQLVEWPPARRIIVEALGSNEPALQKAALALDYAGWHDTELARSALFPLIDHDEVDIRLRTYELLSKYQPEALEEKLRALIHQGDFGTRPMGEVRFLMQKYVETSPSNLDGLRCQLDTRGWFGEAKLRRAKAAARILIEHRDEEAVAVMERLAHSIWTAPRLKQAYQRLLQAARTSGETPED